MSLLQRVLGICSTNRPADEDCWRHSNGRIEVDLKRAPELAEPGGAIRIEDDLLPQRVLVVHGTDGRYRAFLNKCTHATGRRVDLEPDGAGLRCCSVGQSTFDLEGRYLSGPAPGDLTAYQVDVDGDMLVIHLG